MDLPTVAMPWPAGSRPDASRADAGRAAPSARVLWYEAPTPLGALRLCATGARLTARHAADAAIALLHCAELLDALDRWTGLDLAWAWADAPPADAAHDNGASATWRARADDASTAAATHGVECRIDLPWGLLRSLPAPDPALGQRLQWSSVPAVLNVARLRLSRDELRQVEPGGAVLLPQSLLPNWQGVLRTLGESARGGNGVPVALSPAGRPRLVPRSNRPEAAPAVTAAGAHDGELGAYEVRLAVARALPASHYTGWVDAEIDDVGPQASLWHCGSEERPPLCVAVGRLMPWGDGFALALEAVWGRGAEVATEIV